MTLPDQRAALRPRLQVDALQRDLRRSAEEKEVFVQRMCQWLIDPTKVPGNIMEVTRGTHCAEHLSQCLRGLEQFLVEKPERVQKVHEYRTIIKIFSFLHPENYAAVVHQQALQVLKLCASHPKVIEDVIVYNRHKNVLINETKGKTNHVKENVTRNR